MVPTRRWQDYGMAIVGLLLLISPIGFASGLGAVDAWAAYVLGAIVLLLGAAKLAIPSFRYEEAFQVALAVVVFFSPWLFGFAAVTGMAWTAWILAVALVLLVASESYGTDRYLSPTT